MRAMTMIRSVLLPLLLLGLMAGCSDERKNLTPTTQAVGLGLGYEIVKTKVERRLEVTCNPLNLISDGTYCVSNYKPTDRQEVFCFKTLGGVDCYAEPDPYSLEGRQLPAPPRALADPRMPMDPPGRRSNPPQVATAPIGAEPTTIVLPADEPGPTILAPAATTGPQTEPANRAPAGPSEIRPARPM